MTFMTPLGSAARSIRAEEGPPFGPAPSARSADSEDAELWYLGWEIARCATGLPPAEQRAVAAVVAACIASMRAGSTRMPADGEPFAGLLETVGGLDEHVAAQSVVRRAREAQQGDPVTTIIGRPGDRTPLIVDGSWIYPERMRVLEDRFCTRVRRRLVEFAAAAERRSFSRAVTASGAGMALTNEQKRAVREALQSPLTLITGGPGTGKTTTVVALVRAVAWLGAYPMDAIAIGAPTGKAAQRLADALTGAFAAASRPDPGEPRASSPQGDMAAAALAATVPAPLTLHRLLGWSPTSGRFARHENDPLPHRLVVVDEASMIDLAMMDRLLRALRPDARLVLLGDAHQLPSVDAGAVFRDLCAALNPVKLTVNLRVAREPEAQRIITAATAVNAGSLDGEFSTAVAACRAVSEVSFQGVEHLARNWSDVAQPLLDRWWAGHGAPTEAFVRGASRIYRLRAGGFDETDRVELRSLFVHHARARILCATRVFGLPTSAETINAHLLDRLPESVGDLARLRGPGRLWPGCPVLVQRNDYTRGLYNGDQGVVVTVDVGDSGGPQLMTVFARSSGFDALPTESIPDLAPSFAMTVHKAQGSEFDEVLLVLPESDMPLLTRELVYTAITRARRAVLLVGSKELLARAVARTSARYSGVAERLRVRSSP